MLNLTTSNCIDVNGNTVENVLSVNDGNVVVTSNKTVYCSLYFDFYITAREITYTNNGIECEEVQCAIDELYGRINGKLSENLVAGLKRYQGKEVDNYICFGTTDKDTCVGNTDRYMYRIIGIDNSNQMKLIKKEALNTAYAWNTNKESNTTWENSTLYANLNGSYFLTNTTYVPNSGWSNRIALVDWKYGDLTNSSATLQEIATIEQGFSREVNAKIGLLYVHDYGYALAGGNNCTSGGICELSWINLCQNGNDLEAPECGYEWTMTRYTHMLKINQAWVLHSYKTIVDSKEVDRTLSVRPVFYLTSTQEIASGSGTLNDPYILR